MVSTDIEQILLGESLKSEAIAGWILFAEAQQAHRGAMALPAHYPRPGAV